MAYFKLNRFTGIAPGVSPRLLAEQFGQNARNVDFESGALVPLKEEGSSVKSLPNSLYSSIYLYEAPNGTTQFLSWTQDDVQAVEGPIPGDSLYRLYWTGEGAPKMGVQTSIVAGADTNYPEVSYTLGVAAPSAAPTVDIDGELDPDITPLDIAYVFTLVTAYGEEGPPSEASTVYEFTPSTQTATISLVTSLPANSNFDSATALKRIYRSNTGSNTTQFQYVDQVPITQNSYDDTKAASDLGEVLPSGSWIAPPNDDLGLYPDGPLQGLATVANGVLVGFTGKRLCLSEPYLPHAWPISYRITLEEDIVAIGTVASGIVCLTNGKPYFVTGVDPSAMTAVQIDLAQACINKKSVVDMGDYLLYAGPDGLCAVTGTEGSVMSRGIISPLQWNADFSPQSIQAFEHEGSYVAFTDVNTADGWLGWIFDPRAQESAFSFITTPAQVRGGFKDLRSGQLYIISGLEVLPFTGGSSNRTATWKSKIFVTPQPSSMGWVHVDADAYPASGVKNRVKVWADRTLIADYYITENNGVYTQETTVPAGISNGTLREPIMRLPAVVAKEWEVEVSAGVTVNEVCIAQSIDEIKAL